MHISQLVRQKRQELGLTQTALAQKLAEASGDSKFIRQWVARLEQNEFRRPISHKKMSVILSVLDLKATDLDQSLPEVSSHEIPPDFPMTELLVRLVHSGKAVTYGELLRLCESFHHLKSTLGD